MYGLEETDKTARKTVFCYVEFGFGDGKQPFTLSVGEAFSEVKPHTGGQSNFSLQTL